MTKEEREMSGRPKKGRRAAAVAGALALAMAGADAGAAGATTNAY